MSLFHKTTRRCAYIILIKNLKFFCNIYTRAIRNCGTSYAAVSKKAVSSKNVNRSQTSGAYSEYKSSRNRVRARTLVSTAFRSVQRGGSLRYGIRAFAAIRLALTFASAEPRHTIRNSSTDQEELYVRKGAVRDLTIVKVIARSMGKKLFRGWYRLRCIALSI